MHGPRGDQDLFPDLRVADASADLEFHIPFQHDDQFVRGVCEVLLSPAGRVGPERAAESPPGPVRGNLFTIDGSYCQGTTSRLEPAKLRCSEDLGCRMAA